MNKKQTNINILVNIVAFAVQMVIGFYTTPVLTEALGTEAYGFIGLSNDFVNYMSLITTVFNSVVARFISYEIAKGNIRQAESYFNSILIANCCLSGLFAVVALVVVPNVNFFFDVPEHLVGDVKMTFLITFITYIIGVLTSIFTTATYVKNRLDIQGGRNIIQYLIRLVCIIIFLNTIQIHIYWVSVSSFVATVVIAVLNIRITKKLMPEIKINLRSASWESVKTLVAAGGWMAFTSLSHILMRGMDLVIANLNLGAYDMGLLSVARTFPNHFSSIVGTLAPIFTPVFISLFAVGKIDDLVKSTCDSIKNMGLIMMVPISGFIIFSRDFYSLWLKNYTPEEIRIVSALSIITIIQCYFNSTTATMAQMSVVANKLKTPVFVSFTCGVINVAAVLILLNFTSLGVYAIVITSTVIMLLRYILFNTYYCAHILGQSVKVFLKPMLSTWTTIPVLLAIMAAYRHFVSIESWPQLIIAAAVCAAVGYTAAFLIIERRGALKKAKALANKYLGHKHIGGSY